MSAPFEGGCRCGAIRYRCASEPVVALHCWCRDCQYSSGGAGVTALVCVANDVVITGSPASHAVEAESGVTVERLFCRSCGTPLFARNPTTAALLAVKAGTLDDPSWVTPSAHIWTASAPPWACIADDLPRYAKNLGVE
jgi:hypothetical protein